MAEPILRARSALCTFAAPTAGTGVIAMEHAVAGVARLGALRAQHSQLAAALSDTYGLSLPSGPQCSVAGDLTCVGLSRDSWLLMTHTAPAGQLAQATGPFAAFARNVRGLAALTDQSGACTLVRITGTDAQEVLARALPVDLHPSVFPVGSAASTLLAYVEVTLWRCADEPSGLPAFTLAIPRSLSISAMQALSASAGQCGLSFQAAG